MRTRPLLITAFVLVAAAALALIAYRFTASAPEADHGFVSAITRCSEDSRTLIDCARPLIVKSLESRTGADIMNQLASALAPGMCHTAGHVVGQESYRKYGDVEQALDQCNNACDSACVHGTVGEAFIETAGIDDADFDPAHLDAQALKALGSRLCTRQTTCHGVGHALFQAYGTTSPAVGVCTGVATGGARTYCYRGIFMEYADSLASQSALARSPAQTPSIETVAKTCNSLSTDARRACLRYLPRMTDAVLSESGQPQFDRTYALLNLCGQFAGTDRDTCFAGIGVSSSRAVFDPSAYDKCPYITNTADHAACIFGMISTAAEYKDKTRDAAAYCHALADDESRGICYQGLFYTLASIGITAHGSPSLSEICAKDGDPLCAEGMRSYKTDIWSTLRSFRSRAPIGE